MREAACQCLGELATKLPADQLRPHLPALLRTLLTCLHDEAWTVRDMACVAAGSFVRSCPEESREYLAILRPLFMENLRHPISTIGQGAALALADCVRAYGAELLEPLSGEIRAGLGGLHSQHQQHQGTPDGGSRQPTGGSQPKEEEVRVEQEEQGYMLVDPRLQQCGDCCSDLATAVSRPSEPWELAEGCLHLLTEISTIQGCDSWVGGLLPLMAESGLQRHYGHHLHYCTSLCGCLARLASSLPKRLLKANLEDFFDTIFYTLESGNSLASYSAEICLHKIATAIGPNILRGRIENYNPRYLSLYTKLVSSPLLPSSSSAAAGQQGGPTTVATMSELRSSLSILVMSSSSGPASQRAASGVAIPGSGRSSCVPSLGGTPT